MPYTGSTQTDSATGIPSAKTSKSMGSGSPLRGKRSPFGNSASGGKLNKSGATTKSESLARLRGKGALA